MIFGISRKTKGNEQQMYYKRRRVENIISIIRNYEKRTGHNFKYFKNRLKSFLIKQNISSLEEYERLFAGIDIDIENILFLSMTLYDYYLEKSFNMPNTEVNDIPDSQTIIGKLGFDSITLDNIKKLKKSKKLAIIISFLWCDLIIAKLDNIKKYIDRITDEINLIQEKQKSIITKISSIDRDLIYGERLRQNEQIFNAINNISNALNDIMAKLNEYYRNLINDHNLLSENITTIASSIRQGDIDNIIVEELKKFFDTLDRYNKIYYETFILLQIVKIIRKLFEQFEYIIDMFLDKDVRRKYINDLREIYHKITRTLNREKNPEELIGALFYPVPLYLLYEYILELSKYIKFDKSDIFKKSVDDIKFNYAKLMASNIDMITITIE